MWTEQDGILRHDGLVSAGLLHGVTTRSLGDMKRPEARAFALEKAGVDPEAVRTLKQVHGRRVVRWQDAAPRVPEADALIASRPGSGLGIFVADCQPVFLWDETGEAIGLAHLGWRGTAAGLARVFVEAFTGEYGVEAKDLRAVVGPHIRSCCYEVGPEVAGRFHEDAILREGPAVRLDLAAVTAHQLKRAGVGGVDAAAPCTRCGSGLFYSYRREKGAGRMLAFFVKPR